MSVTPGARSKPARKPGRKPRVLVLEEDVDIRMILAELCGSEGYDVVQMHDALRAAAYLRGSREPVVVLCGNGDASHLRLLAFFARVAAQVPSAARHHYICLTSAPSHVPAPLRSVFSQLAVQVLTKPFDVDVVLLAVAHAAAATRAVPEGFRGRSA